MTVTSTSKDSSIRDLASLQPTARGLSLGAGIAIVGVCLASVALVAFFCLLNYTTILVDNSAAREKTDGSTWFFILMVTLSPGYAGYFLCSKIINKG